MNNGSDEHQLDLASLAGGMWRHREHLPIDDPRHIVSLGEGGTPLLPVVGRSLRELGLSSLHLKAEHRNPTGSFKDRLASVAASIIVERRLGGAVGTSSGNGGAAMAAYGARAGVPVVLFTVAGIVDGKLQQILAHGAATNVVRALGHEGAAGRSIAPTIAGIAADLEWLPFLTGARFSPEVMQGAETIADELTEQLSDVDRVYIPVGGGGLLGSIWRGYSRAGGAVPRLIGVQPTGCPTLARAVAGDRTPLVGQITTTVSGLQVPMLFDYGAIDAVEATGGHVVEVSDEDVWSAQRLLARDEGVFVEPAGAAALAGLLADVRAGGVGRDERVVVITSGAGHKDPQAAQRLAGSNLAVDVAPDEIAGILTSMPGRQR